MLIYKYHAYWFDLSCMHLAEIFHHNIVHIPYTPFMTILGNMPWWADVLNKHENGYVMYSVYILCTIGTRYAKTHIYIVTVHYCIRMVQKCCHKFKYVLL